MQAGSPGQGRLPGRVRCAVTQDSVAPKGPLLWDSVLCRCCPEVLSRSVFLTDWTVGLHLTLFSEPWGSSAY